MIWQPICRRDGWPERDIRTLMGACLHDGRLFVGARGSALVLEYDWNRWRVHSEWPNHDRIDTFATHDGRLHAGVSGPRGARGSVWSLDGQWREEAQFPGPVWKLLDAGGRLYTAAMIEAGYPGVFRREDDGTWSCIGEFPGYTHLLDLAWHGGALYVGGIGSTVIWCWQGDAWSRERVPVPGSVTALHSIDGTLYAGLWRRRGMPLPMLWRRGRTGWRPCEWGLWCNARLVETVVRDGDAVLAGGGYPRPLLWSGGRVEHTWPGTGNRYVYTLTETPRGLVATFGGDSANGGEVWLRK